MRSPAGALLTMLALLGVVGCQGSPAPPPPKGENPPPTGVPAAPIAPTKPPEAKLDTSTAYTKEHPWGEDTGTARLSGTMSWAEGNDPPKPLWRRSVVLIGLKDTPSAGLFYNVFGNEQGEYVFDRIKAGQFQLTDRDGNNEVHWRLRVEVEEGGEKILDLTPDSGIKVRDDFPREGN